MTDRIEEVLTEQLAKNLWDRLTNGPRWIGSDEFPAVLAEEARGILAALKAARIQCVELAEPTAPDFTGTEWSGPDWDVFAYGSTRHRGEVEVRSRRYNTPETARQLAAALLAAADAAEASQ